MHTSESGTTTNLKSVNENGSDSLKAKKTPSQQEHEDRIKNNPKRICDDFFLIAEIAILAVVISVPLIVLNV